MVFVRAAFGDRVECCPRLRNGLPFLAVNRKEASAGQTPATSGCDLDRQCRVRVRIRHTMSSDPGDLRTL